MKNVLLLLGSLFLFSPFLMGQSPPCATDLINDWKVLADSSFTHQHAVHRQIVNRYREQQQQGDAFWNQYHNENDSGGGGSLQGLIECGGRNVYFDRTHQPRCSS